MDCDTSGKAMMNGQAFHISVGTINISTKVKVDRVASHDLLAHVFQFNVG